jgi:molecular chaperone GrpE
MENGKSSFNRQDAAGDNGAGDDASAVERQVGEGGPDEPPASVEAPGEVERLNSQLADVNTTILRLRADYDNFRKRAERERAEVYDYASMEVIRGLLPVVDDFERALGAAPSLDGPSAEYVKGMELIYQRMVDALSKLGLQPIEAVGQPFDPNLHHAVQMEQTEESEDHVVLEQYQRGYNFKGKLLRAAMVKVAVKP